MHSPLRENNVVMHYPEIGRWCALFAVSALALAAGCTGSIGDPGTNGSNATGSTTGQGSNTSAAGKSSQSSGGNGGATNSGTGSTPGAGGNGSNNGGAGGGSTGNASGGSTSGPGGPSGVNLNGAPAFHRFVRLTHEQWEASVRDVLKLTALPGLSTMFATDPPNGTFSNNERALFVSSTLWSDYQRAAETLSAKVATDSAALSRISGGTTDAATFIKNFGRRIFRRPLTSAEETSYKNMFDQGPTLVGSGNNFADGAQLVIESMLQSPNFVYRTELGNDGAALSGYEMASKLSFLLRNTTPDDALLDAAAAGQLNTSANVVAKATAMLDEPAAKAVLGRYHAELFGLARYSSIDKNRTKFPMYSEALNADLEQADRMFFDRIFTAGQGVKQILTTPVAFVSSLTAPIYGVSASGSGLTETQLGADRPGFLTRLGFLAYNANLSDPDPIHRGVDIINRLMCFDLLPPADVAIPPLPAAMPGQTNRQRVSAHTGDGTCGQGCHSTLINPMGFAFENFDAIGKIRTTDNGQNVDTSGSMGFPDGTKSFSGAPELVKLLSTTPSVHGCYVKHLTEFALTRDTAARDRSLVDAVEGMSMNSDASVKAMILEVIKHPSFLTRIGGAQ
ncbi:MAG: DUF1592 domain-containing protein [Myxococcota bacterium]